MVLADVNLFFLLFVHDSWKVNKWNGSKVWEGQEIGRAEREGRGGEVREQR